MKLIIHLLILGEDEAKEEIQQAVPERLVEEKGEREEEAKRQRGLFILKLIIHLLI